MARRRLGFWRRLTVMVVKPTMLLLTRRQWEGGHHLPAAGGAIIAVNHLSQADPPVVAHYVYDHGRWPQFLGKHQLFEIPVIGRILHRLKQIPVRRGTVDAARALDAAAAAVRAGEAVIIYPEGTTTRDPQLWPMRGRTGVARLWLDTGVPVIPLVTWGPQRIHDPRTGKLRPRPRTPVTVAAGPPVDLGRFRDAPVTNATMHEITAEIMRQLRTLLSEVRGDQPPAVEAPAEQPQEH